jgi:hypothetical protein
MTFTYSSTALSTDTTSQVRLLIYDTSSGSALFADEEIDWFISANANIYGAASAACKALAARYADKVDKAVGDLRLSLSQKAARYASLASEYAQKSAAYGYCAPFAGGISVASKDTYEQNSDRVVPAFTRTTHGYLSQYSTST